MAFSKDHDWKRETSESNWAAMADMQKRAGQQQSPGRPGVVLGGNEVLVAAVEVAQRVEVVDCRPESGIGNWRLWEEMVKRQGRGERIY